MASFDLQSPRLGNCSASIGLGRLLRFSPSWPCSDAQVLFDCNSGDYWVVSLLAAELIKLLQSGVVLTAVELERQLQGVLPELDLSADLPPTLQSLSDSGLVMLQSWPMP